MRPIASLLTPQKSFSQQSEHSVFPNLLYLTPPFSAQAAQIVPRITHCYRPLSPTYYGRTGTSLPPESCFPACTAPLLLTRLSMHRPGAALELHGFTELFRTGLEHPLYEVVVHCADFFDG